MANEVIGSTWIKSRGSADFTARKSHTSAVTNGTIWVIGGYDGARRNDVWHTFQGVSVGAVGMLFGTH